MKSPLEALPAQLGELMLRDQQRLRSSPAGREKIKNPDAQLAVAADVEKRHHDGAAKVQARAASCPRITYPEASAGQPEKQDILNAIRDHQVVIVAGETGSGKPPSCRRSVWSWGVG